MVSKRKALIVSSNKDMFTKLKDAIQSKQFISIQHGTSAIDAKTRLRNEKVDLVILVTPLVDEFGINTARDISHSFDVNVILLVKSDIYDQTVYKLQEERIFVLSTPTNRMMVYQTVNMMHTFIYQLSIRDKEINKLRKKLLDQQKINQAKLILVENYHYTEEKAHKYLEKLAMDNSMTKVMVAQSIIEKAKGV
ncbi:MAG: ANTAR domain-containing protein [Holdemanella sp.]|nr:ANTAR domain-containing protein [Holdemanella sp.]